MEYEQNDLIFEVNHEKRTAALKKCLQDTGTVVVPRFVKYERKKNYKVTSISSGAFCYKHLNCLTFANNSEVTTFDYSAFESAYIQIIQIPAKLQLIRDGAFFHLEDVRFFNTADNPSFTFHNNEILIGKNDEKSKSFDAVYCGISDLKEVIIPSSVKILKSYCFSGCKNLESIKFEENSQIEIIESWILCDNLKTLEIPKTLKRLNIDAFSLANSLVNLEVSPENEVFKYVDNSMLIEGSCIWFCRRNVTEVVIPNYITEIGRNAFNKCKNLVSISFEENSSLESIYESAFNDVPGQENLVIPASVKYLSKYVFLNMENVKTIVFLGEEVEISKGCFGCCSNLVSVSFPNAKKIVYNNEIPKETKIYLKKDAEITGNEVDEKKENIEFIIEKQESKNEENFVLDQDQQLKEAQNQETNENNSSKCCLLI